MARKRRIFVDSQIYHIVIRGNNKQDLFLDNYDRNFFISKLKKYLLHTSIDLYGYCLMDNHVHILIGQANRYMPLFMQKLEVTYAYYFNKKYQHCGHVFQDRYKSEPVTSQYYFINVLRYIIKNPENAGICNYEKFRWNSYTNTINEKNFVKTTIIFSNFGSKESFIKEIKRDSSFTCMEYENKPRFSDELFIKFIKAQFHIKNITQISQLNTEKRNYILVKLKDLGFSTNQISRVIAINKKIISSAYTKYLDNKYTNNT